MTQWQFVFCLKSVWQKNKNIILVIGPQFETIVYSLSKFNSKIGYFWNINVLFPFFKSLLPKAKNKQTKTPTNARYPEVWDIFGEKWTKINGQINQLVLEYLLYLQPTCIYWIFLNSFTSTKVNFKMSYMIHVKDKWDLAVSRCCSLIWTCY